MAKISKSNNDNDHKSHKPIIESSYSAKYIERVDLNASAIIEGIWALENGN